MSDAKPAVFELHIPERRRPFHAILDRPDRLFVAWHKDCKGIHELLDAEGLRDGHRPQEELWQVREYRRTICYETAAYYECERVA